MNADRKTQLVSSIAVVTGSLLIVGASVGWFVSGELNPILTFSGVLVALFGVLYGLPSNIRAIRRAMKGDDR
ncbi:hypothetical protein ACEXQD_06785 [Herbiconiux sp. P15]|uniref:hypothetical protein n=1 Tax=Herbiconiux liukaitaii TaxID=3342799 RepID=UPI0035B9F1E4